MKPENRFVVAGSNVEVCSANCKSPGAERGPAVQFLAEWRSNQYLFRADFSPLGCNVMAVQFRGRPHAGTEPRRTPCRLIGSFRC